MRVPEHMINIKEVKTKKTGNISKLLRKCQRQNEGSAALCWIKDRYVSAEMRRFYKITHKGTKMSRQRKLISSSILPTLNDQ